MSPMNFRLPNADEIRNVDPKEALINHGEKIVLLAAAVVLVLTVISLVGGVATSGSASARVERKIERLRRMLRTDAKPIPPQDIISIVKEITAPLPESDAWDTTSARVAYVVGQVRALIGELGKTLYITKHPDIGRNLKPHLLSAGVAHGYIFTGAHPNPEDMRKWRLGLLPASKIVVEDEARDMQWAVLYGWFDLREVVAEFDRLLGGLKEVLEKERQVAARRGAFRPGRVPSGGPTALERLAAEGGAYWMPYFKGFEVEREDLERPGVWEPVDVPPPAVYALRQQGLPRPPGLGSNQVWPPPVEPLWEGGRKGFRSVVRRDPLPELPDRIRTVPPPDLYQLAPRELPGGIIYQPEPDKMAGAVEALMSRYLQARRRLQELAAILSDPTLDPEKRQEYERERIVQQRVAERVHGMGFRFVDTTVEPGHRYRYRLRILVANPCAELPRKYVSDSARRPAVLKTVWTEPSPVVEVPHNVEFWLTSVGAPGPDGRVDKAMVEIHTLYRGVWRVVQGTFRIGDRIVWRGPLKVVKVVRQPGVSLSSNPTSEAEERKVVEEMVTLDTGAVLVDIVPTSVLRALPGKRTVLDPATGKMVSTRDFLRAVTYLAQRSYRMVYLDVGGRIRSKLQGEIPERARRRRRAYRKWLASGLQPFQPRSPRRTSPGGERVRPPVPTSVEEEIWHRGGE